MRSCLCTLSGQIFLICCLLLSCIYLSLVQLRQSNAPDPQIEELSIDEEDPARPSGKIDHIFEDIEDPRVSRLFSIYLKVNMVGAYGLIFPS